MKSIFVTVLFFMISLAGYGQGLNMTFSASGAAGSVTTVTATNFQTGQVVALPGDQTLILRLDTGIPDESGGWIRRLSG